jgi:MYXO-CTERM domain-containing protein
MSRSLASTPPALQPIGVFAIMLASAPSPARAADTESSGRPPALEGRTGCELWVGKVSGNDPSVLVEALICEGINGAVTGQLQWSSLQSGYSIRDIAGSWKGSDKLNLHDTKIAVSKPNPGWQFCQVDSYDLTRSGDQLRGSYHSQKCNDRASVTLTKKAVQPSLPPAVPEAEQNPVEPAPEATRGEEAPSAKSSCACRTAGEDARDGSCAAFFALALLRLARRRRARSLAASSAGSW